MHSKQIDQIYLRLNVIDQRAAWTSTRASIQVGELLENIRNCMETYLNDEFPDWKTDKELNELFNRD